MVYSKTDLFLIQNPYFNVLQRNPDCFEVQSKNTRHFWKIEDKGDYLKMLHRYSENEKYHYQTCFGPIEDALLYIAMHDNYKIYGKQHEFYTRGIETFVDTILKEYKNTSSDLQ